MTYLSRPFSLAVLAAVLVSVGMADTIQINGSVTPDSADAPGSILLTFDVDRGLLPAINDPVNHGGQISISNVSVDLDFPSGFKDKGSGGSGQIDPFSTTYSVLEFSAGDINGSFGLPSDYNGTQDLIPNINGSSTSFLRYGSLEGILTSAQSTLVDTPEPTTSSLAGLAFIILGWLGVRSRRRSSETT